MTATQFLGAFNDNLFKQLLLLICVDFSRSGSGDFQPIAMALFAVPFVLFSGFAGYLSDRTGKRRIVVLCKVAEVAVMVLGMLAFFGGTANPQTLVAFLFIVLFLMSTQSAFFGPAKYGILPELFRDEDLPAANGAVQMTTFVAIIFGMALAGFAKEWFADQLWLVSMFCIGLAVLGTLTSLAVRRTPVAHPGLEFRPSALAVNAEAWQILRKDRALMGVLLISSLFWFVGGVIQQTVNDFGKRQLNWGDGRTSMLAACLGVGIAAGCILAGKLSRKRINFTLVSVGVWGIIVCLAILLWLGVTTFPVPVPVIVRTGGPIVLPPPETLWQLMLPRFHGEIPIRLAMTGVGLFAGLFVVPLQVFMQIRPPEDQKGRMIGTMNLINWIGIMLSAAFVFVCHLILNALNLPVCWTFAAVAAILLPVGLFYRPRIDKPA